MATKSKSTGKQTTDNQATAAGKAPETGAADWARQGVEGIVEAQKRWAEIASQQSGQLYDAIREGMSVTPSDVSRAVSDYAGQGLEAFVKARTQWLDFA